MVNGTRIQVTVGPKVLEKLDKTCEEKGVRRSAIVSLALDEYLRKEEREQ